MMTASQKSTATHGAKEWYQSIVTTSLVTGKTHVTNGVNHLEESTLKQEAAMEDQVATGLKVTTAGELAHKNGREKSTAEMALKTGSVTLIALARVDIGSQLTMITGESGMKSVYGQTSATLLSLQRMSEQFIASGPWLTFLVIFFDTNLFFLYTYTF